MVAIVPIDTPSLGDRSYLAHDGEVALVVDPQRDVDRVLAVAEREGVRITHVFETHIHNDYVTGGRALANETGATYHVNADDEVSFERVGVRDDDVVTVGSMSVTVLATPGHTFTHLSYALAGDEGTIGVFSGGSLTFGSTGRPDLLGEENTDALVHHQYDSVQRLASELPDEAQVLPTHGFGSFCSATQSDADSSTIGTEKRTNPALTKSEDEWVEEILAGLSEWPAYYAHMGPANADAPQDAPDLTLPATVDKDEIRASLEAGEWVVDLRNREAYAKGHVGRTVNFGVDGQFATYLGWIMPWGASLTLLGDSPEQVAEAQRELVRVGIERLRGAGHGRSAGVDRRGAPVVRARHVRRPRSGASPPRSDRPRRATRRRVRPVPHRRRRQRAASRRARAPQRDSFRRTVGALRGWLPRLDRVLPPRSCGPPRGRRR